LFGGTIRYISVQKIKRRLEVEQERVRISNDMHDEIGSGLTRITLLSEVAKKKLGESEEIRRISDASRDVVQNMDEIVWAVNPQYDTLENLAIYILQYAQEFFQMTNIILKTHYPEVITGEFVSAESRHSVFMVIKEVFNNIAKHADAEEVQLIFNSCNGMYEFIIQDNGRGFDIKSAGMFSNGLKIMHKRIKMINGKLNIESYPGKGTKIIIKVPY
jgi:signal transduction histidine kinase